MATTPTTDISPERPLIILQTSNRFGDSDEGYAAKGTPLEEATLHGREAVRVWEEVLPEALRPYCQLQMELRVRDHVARYERLRRILEPLETASIPVDLQVSDPHDPFVFDPAYVEKLLDEFACIKSVTITENRFERFSDYNVPRYALSPHAQCAMDVIPMAAERGKHVLISLQDMKWLHVCAGRLNQPLFETIRTYGEHVIPLNEHIGPRYLPRQASVWGTWLSEHVDHWGIEPQSWWFENGRMIEPGVFGQREPDNTRIMPPDLYRAMILLGACMGATVYDFEPFWDLFDYDNSHCWRDVIAPTLLEVIEGRLIPTREQVMEKVKVAYQYGVADTITEFHEILRDVDWIGDEGLLSKAAYGLWAKYLQHELIPNKHRYFFIPLVPKNTPDEVLARFDEVVETGQCASAGEYEALLNTHYPDDSHLGSAWVTSINGYTYVFQTHENLYERQTYAVELPKPVTGIRAERKEDGVHLTWPADPGATLYRIHRVEGEGLPRYPGFSETIWRVEGETFADPELRGAGEDYHHHAVSKALRSYRPYPIIATTNETAYVDTACQPGATYTYTVTAETSTKATRTGVVNYLDFVVFSDKASLPGEQIVVNPKTVRNIPFGDPEDTRPERQEWYPTFDGVGTGEERKIAEAIVERIDAMKVAYDGMDWRGLTDLYAEDYRDQNGFSKEYVGLSWKWWFFRNNNCTLLSQIRRWDFTSYADEGVVRVRLFSLFRATRWDDHKWGYHYDGTLRLPRHANEEIVYSWKRQTDGVWRLVETNPSMPCLQDMLWYSRGSDCEAKLTPGLDERYE